MQLTWNGWAWPLLSAALLPAVSPSLEADAAGLEEKEAASTDSGQKYHCNQQNALARGQMGPALHWSFFSSEEPEVSE